MARIILAEDDKASRFIIEHLLRSLGHVPYCCQDGLEAYQVIVANAQAYDLILTDIAMPNLDGVSLCKKLRTEMQVTTPIVAMTSYDKSIFNEELTAYFNAWLLKPIRKEVLQQTLQEVLAEAA